MMTLTKTSWVFIRQTQSLDTSTFKKLLKKKKHPTICNIQYRQNQQTWHALVEFFKYLPEKRLFDSFGFKGLRYFIIDNDKNIIDKLLYNLKSEQFQ